MISRLCLNLRGSVRFKGFSESQLATLVRIAVARHFERGVLALVRLRIHLATRAVLFFKRVRICLPTPLPGSAIGICETAT